MRKGAKHIVCSLLHMSRKESSAHVTFAFTCSRATPAWHLDLVNWVRRCFFALVERVRVGHGERAVAALQRATRRCGGRNKPIVFCERGKCTFASIRWRVPGVGPSQAPHPGTTDQP